MARFPSGLHISVRSLVIAGAVLIGGTVVGYLNRSGGGWFDPPGTADARPPLHPRSFPLKLRANFGNDRIAPSVPVTQEDVQRLNHLFEPAYALKSPSHLLHYLYLWGPEARFDGSPAPSGQQMLSLLFNESQNPAYRPRRPLVYKNSFGQIAIDSMGATDAEAHVDQFLSMIGDLGVSLDRRVTVQDGVFTLKDALLTSVENFTMSQELEWTVSAYARYLAPSREWRNRWGERFSFDDVVEAFLKRGTGIGPCQGTHALHTLCVLVQVDRTYPILSAEHRARILERLIEVGAHLERSQHRDGCWSPKWATTARFERFFPEDRPAVFQATGHHLEWMRIAPPETLPSPETLRKAIDWCVLNLRDIKPIAVSDDPCPYVHCAKSLACLSMDVRNPGFFPISQPPGK